MSVSLTLPDADELMEAKAADTTVFPRRAGQLHAHTIVFSKLAFPVAHLFAAGSPIATFLTMRGASAVQDDPCHGPHLLPPRTRVFNLYHSVDPLAYRMEPLLIKGELEPPVVVDPWPRKEPSILSASLALESISKAADSFFSHFTSRRSAKKKDGDSPGPATKAAATAVTAVTAVKDKMGQDADAAAAAAEHTDLEEFKKMVPDGETVEETKERGGGS